MKKLTFLFVLLAGFLIGTAQTPIQFYVNGKVATSADCHSLDNLKVKFKVPSTVKNYDGTTCEVLLSGVDVGFYIWEPEDYYSGGYFNAYILKNDKANGDFVYGDTPISMKDVCKNIGDYQKLEVEFMAYHKTGMETYWDDYSESWKTRPTWDSGKLLAKGEMKIKQFDKPSGFASEDGKIKGVYADPNVGHFWDTRDDYTILYRYDDYDLKLKVFVIYKKDIENKDLYEQAKENNPNLSVYDFVKMDLMAWVGSYNQNVNFESNKTYIDKTAIKWADTHHFDVFYGYCNPDYDVTELDEDHQKGFKAMFADWQPKYFNKPELWSKYKTDKYEFDYLHVDNFHPVAGYNYESSKKQYVKKLADEKGFLDAYLLEFDDAIVVLSMEWNGPYNSNYDTFVPGDYSLKEKIIEPTLQNLTLNF